MNSLSILLLITLAALVVNLPFGYMRTKTRKFTVAWFLCIHAPIPLIFVLRTYAGFTYKVIPLLIGAAVLGQILGGKLRKESCGAEGASRRA